MRAEEVYNIAIHLPEKELERLYTLLDKKINSVTLSKTKKKILVTDKEAIDYLLKMSFLEVYSPKKYTFVALLTVHDCVHVSA